MAEKKYLDSTGLTHLWSKIKSADSSTLAAAKSDAASQISTHASDKLLHLPAITEENQGQILAVKGDQVAWETLTLPLANDSTAGFVKTGGDATIANGEITVTGGTHHNHTGAQVTVGGESTVSGSTVDVALKTLEDKITAAASGVSSFGGQTGAITLKAASETNGDVNLTMSGKELQAAVVGLKSAAFVDTTAFDSAGAATAVDSKLSAHTGNSAIHIPTGGETGQVLKKTEDGTEWAAEYSYSLPAAGTSLGGVKTGGDVTISAGTITVTKGTNHTHTIAQVSDLNDGWDALLKAAPDVAKDTELTALEGRVDTIESNSVPKSQIVKNVTLQFTGGNDPSGSGVGSFEYVFGPEFADGSNNVKPANFPIASDVTMGVISEKRVKVLAEEVASTVAGSVYRVKGTKATIDEVLAVSAAEIGDTYNVTAEFTLNSKKYPAGTNVVFVGPGEEGEPDPKQQAQWDALGGTVDLTPYETTAHASSTYATKTELTSGLDEKAEKTHTHNVSEVTGALSDAPSDEFAYGRKAGAWTKVIELPADPTPFGFITSEGTMEVRAGLGHVDSGSVVLGPFAQAITDLEEKQNYITDSLFFGQHCVPSDTGMGKEIDHSVILASDLSNLGNFRYSAIFGGSSTVNDSSCLSLIAGYMNEIEKSDYSLIVGNYNQANNDGEFVSGQYCISNTGDEDSQKTIVAIGNGASNDARKNAFEIMKNGDVYVTGVGSYDGTNYSGAQTLQEVISAAASSGVTSFGGKTGAITVETAASSNGSVQFTMSNQKLTGTVDLSSRLQASDIVEGTTVGAITVKGTPVQLHGFSELTQLTNSHIGNNSIHLPSASTADAGKILIVGGSDNKTWTKGDLPIATGSTAGLVKTGGDVSISNGVITITNISDTVIGALTADEIDAICK